MCPLFILIDKSINLSLIHWDRRDRGAPLNWGILTPAKMGLAIHSVTASAPGKVILFGEHTVLYKAPALACAIDLRCRVVVKVLVDNPGKLEILLPCLNYSRSISYHDAQQRQLDYGGVPSAVATTVQAVLAIFHVIYPSATDLPSWGLRLKITSVLPLGAGLGSSAALSVSLAAALWCIRWQQLEVDRSAIRELSHIAECIFHGKPSGLDHGTVMAGGMIYFCDQAWEEYKLPEQTHLLIINTNMPRSTRTMVEKVATYAQSNQSSFLDILQRISELVEMALVTPWEHFSPLIQENQKLLQLIGVSNEPIDRVCASLQKKLKLSCKITGAGGGGCLIALLPAAVSEEEHALRQLVDAATTIVKKHIPGAHVLVTQTTLKGLLVESDK